MALKKHYPDQNQLRMKLRQVDRAMLSLLKMGVEIISINFRAPLPLIEVYHCPGTRKINDAELKGQGFNDQGCYVRKKAFIKGCQIEWSEQK